MVIHRLIHLPSPQKKKSKQPRAKATRKPREKNSPVTWTGQSDKQRKIEVRKLQLKEAGSLIQASVGAACRKKYLDSWNRLKATTGLRDQRNMKASVLDQALCRMLNIMFSDGEDLSHAQYMLAASLFFNPHLKSSKQMALPLTKQTLQCWKKLDPPKARLPLPWEAVCGLVELSFLEGQREIGLMMLLCFCLYLRPGEVTRLRVQDLVPPVHGSGGGGAEWTAILHPLEEHIPSKTQEYDETVSFDKPWMRFIAEATYRHLNLSGRGKAEKIFSCSAQQMKKFMEKGFNKLGLESLGSAHPYRLRHGGASRDYQHKMRSLTEIQKRGRWKSAASVRRYEKGGRLNQLLRSLAPKVLMKLQSATKRIEKTVLGQR
jgi:integrase